MAHKAHEQLATEFAEAIVQGMDIKDLMNFVFDILENQYTNQYTYDQLLAEVAEYQPDLLEE